MNTKLTPLQHFSLNLILYAVGAINKNNFAINNNLMYRAKFFFPTCMPKASQKQVHYPL